MSNSIERKTRILLVQEDAEMLEWLRRNLAYVDFEVTVARDGRAGLESALDETPDLIILDMMLPRLSGFLLLDLLRKTHRVTAPIIMTAPNETHRHED
ncbi:MAG: response regulator, partial [Planctomycetales bacterium]